MILGVMTQPLRTKYAAALLDDGAPHVLITSAHADFSTDPLPPLVDLVLVDTPEVASPTDRVVRGPMARRVLRWARSGSRLGRRVERLTRRILWRLRRRHTTTATTPAPYRPDQALVAAITAALDANDIERVVCFDAYDIVAVDAALASLDDTALPVQIR